MLGQMCGMVCPSFLRNTRRGSKVHRGHRLGLLGPEGLDLLALDSVPAVFVVGADGRVVDVIRGFWRNDTRLEAALDSLLLASETP